MAIGFKPQMGGLFGNNFPRGRSPYETPGIGDGMQQHAYAQTSEPEKPKGEGTRRIIGIIGDALLGLGGQQGVYGPMMAHKRMQEQAMQRQQQMAMQARQWANEDWTAHKQWERDNPAPEAPDAFERALRGAGIDPASEQGRGLYQGRAESMARDPNDEFVVVPIPGLGTYAGPRSGLAEAMGGGGGAPAKPVGKLTPIAGGPTPPASGTFRDTFAIYGR